MITFMINNNLFGRADLALTYYPSVFEFYWFVARTFHRMETALQTQPLPKVRNSRGGTFQSMNSTAKTQPSSKVRQSSGAV